MKNDIGLVRSLAFDPPAFYGNGGDMYFADEMVSAVAEWNRLNGMPEPDEKYIRMLFEKDICKVFDSWKTLRREMKLMIGNRRYYKCMFMNEIGKNVFPLPGFPENQWIVFSAENIVERYIMISNGA